jgi:anhydro-N-acetylmuramic acid kinase
MNNSMIFIGLMSGTSLDGVDGVMVKFLEDQQHGNSIQVLANAHTAFPNETKQAAMQLQQAGDNEIHTEALLANQLAIIYANCVEQLRQQAPNEQINSIGVHGQTIRHRPELGFTRQTNNPALLAELTGIDVIADFRSRDIAAGGQGAPLVPAFHRAIFGENENSHRNSVVVNIGGMSNISILNADGSTSGFDTGPGNVLMDAWVLQHCGKAYDENGAWAAQGNVNASLLDRFCEENFFHQAPPKSTGRDLFDMKWLAQELIHYSNVSAVDVQATLCALTAKTIAQAISQYAKQTDAVFVCGGGAYNLCLMQHLQKALSPIIVEDTSHFGVAPNHVEAIAFAWLAKQFTLRQSGNLPQVTGAKGGRVLGALYPA